MKICLGQWPICLAFTIWLVFVWWLFPTMFSAPGDYLYATGADGMKTLFTIAYQIKWGVSPFTFGGMHYPYGDTINFATGHPVLILIFGKSGFSEGKIAAIIQLFLLFGFILTPLIYYRLYRLLEVPLAMAIMAAFGLFMLNPQVPRLNSHIDLAHMWPIPLAILWIFKAHTSRHWFYVPAFILLTLSVFFIHPYLGLMLSGMWTSFFFFKWLIVGEHRLFSAVSMLTGATPLIAFVALSRLIDDRIGRGIPGGFWEMVCRPTSLLMPTVPPLNQPFSFLSGTHPPHWETMAYLGATTIIVLLGFVSVVFYRLIKRQWSHLKEFTFKHQFALLFFLSTLPILWFSMGMSLTGDIRYAFLDKFEMVAQFRAPGRLAWIFWHSATLLSVVILSEWAGQSANTVSPKRNLKFGIAGLLLMFCGTEGCFQTLRTGVARTDVSKNLLNSMYFPEEVEVMSQIKAEGFEAQVTLPYFHIGSENFGPDTDPELKTFAFRIALQTGLPLCNSQMSRTSYTETWQQVSLWYEPFIKSEVTDQFKKEGKVLILAKPHLCNAAENQIISMADSLLTCRDVVLYSIESSKLFDRYLANQAILKAQLSSATAPKAIKTFENYPEGKSCGLRGKWEVLSDINSESLNPGSPWVVSFWVRGANRDRVIRQIFKVGINTENGWRQQFSGALCHQIAGVTEEDALVEFVFTPDMANDSVRIEIFNEELPNNSLRFDNLLIREKESFVVFESDGNTFLNNRPCFLPN